MSELASVRVHFILFNSFCWFALRQGLLEQMNTDMSEEGKGEKSETFDPSVSVHAETSEGSSDGFPKPLMPQVSRT